MKQALQLISAGLLSLAVPAQASSGSEPFVEIEIIDGGLSAQGTYIGALRVTLQDGWKTYWRSPGDSGIPPSFTWRGSRNVGEMSITWPTPEVIMSGGFQTIGYHNQLVLPVEITPQSSNKPVRLKGRMELGICKDVCVPAELKFDHQMDPEAGRHPAIAAALANRPYSASEARVKAAKCTLSPTKYGMRVEARITMPSAGGTEVAVIEPGSQQIYAGDTTTQRTGGILTASTEFLPATTGAFALDRSQLRITVLGSHHAVDIQGCTAG